MFIENRSFPYFSNSRRYTPHLLREDRALDLRERRSHISERAHFKLFEFLSDVLTFSLVMDIPEIYRINGPVTNRRPKIRHLCPNWGRHILQTNAEGVRSSSVQISGFIPRSLLIKLRFGSVALHNKRGSLSSVYVKDIDLLIVGPISV